MNPKSSLLSRIWSAIRFISSLIVNIYFVLVISAIVAFFTFIGKLVQEQEPLRSYTPDNAVLLLNITEPEFSEFSSYGVSAPVWSNKIYSARSSDYSFSELIYGIHQAAKDTKVKGIVINISSRFTNGAQAFELQEALRTVRDANKSVLVFVEGVFFENELLISSAANETFVNPGTYMRNIRPIYGAVFRRGFFDKFDIEYTGFRMSLYKDFILPNVKYQVDEDVKSTFDTLYQNYQDTISIAAHNLNQPVEKFDLNDDQIITLARENNGDFAKAFVKQGWAKGIKSLDEFNLYVAKTVAATTKNSNIPNYFTLGNYISSLEKPLFDSNASKHQRHIAFLTLKGDVTWDGAVNGGIQPTEVLDYLRDIYFNSNSVEALVIRIDSPGGLATTGGAITDAINDIKQLGIPVVVSQGNVAASAGYMMSAPADYIYTTPLTITGSIGVVTDGYNISKLASKFGISSATVGPQYWVSTNNYLATPFVVGNLDDTAKEQLAYTKASITESYYSFIKEVHAGRQAYFKTLNDVHKVAQGHIWTGTEALQLKLVDAIGGTESAIVKAKELALEKSAKRQANEYAYGEYTQLTADDLENLPVIFYNSLYATPANQYDLITNILSKVSSNELVAKLRNELQSFVGLNRVLTDGNALAVLSSSDDNSGNQGNDK